MELFSDTVTWSQSTNAWSIVMPYLRRVNDKAKSYKYNEDIKRDDKF